jgi:hypothetical protein
VLGSNLITSCVLKEKSQGEQLKMVGGSKAQSSTSVVLVCPLFNTMKQALITKILLILHANLVCLPLDIS